MHGSIPCGLRDEYDSGVRGHEFSPRLSYTVMSLLEDISYVMNKIGGVHRHEFSPNCLYSNIYSYVYL